MDAPPGSPRTGRSRQEVSAGKGTCITVGAGVSLSRRSFLHLLLATAGTATMAACVPLRANPTPEGPSRVQLVYQDWRTDWFPALAREMLEQFHATHPNIRVFYTPDPENLEDKMLADMQAGIAPDVFAGCCAFFPIWAQKGYTLDVRSYVKADLDQATIDDWDAAQYHALFTRDGRQFGLPKYHGALALFYNKDLFDAAKIDYPNERWTYREYLDAMKRLTRRDDRSDNPSVFGSMIDVSWDRLQVYVNGWGGHFVDPRDPTVCRMSEPEALEALEWVRARIWDDKVMANGPAVQNVGTSKAFASGRLAMVEDGSWALKQILSTARFRLGVAPFPAGPRRKVTLATTDGFGIFAGTRYPDAAWELVKFLISKDYGRAMAKAHFLQPARASLVDEWIGFIRAEYPQQAKEADFAAFAQGHIQGYSVTTETFATNQAEAKRLADEAWAKVFTLGQAPVDSLKPVCTQIQSAQRIAGAGGCACS